MRPFCAGCFGGLTIASLTVSMQTMLKRVQLNGKLTIKCSHCGRAVQIKG